MEVPQVKRALDMAWSSIARAEGKSVEQVKEENEVEVMNLGDIVFNGVDLTEDTVAVAYVAGNNNFEVRDRIKWKRLIQAGFVPDALGNNIESLEALDEENRIRFVSAFWVLNQSIDSGLFFWEQTAIHPADGSPILTVDVTATQAGVRAFPLWLRIRQKGSGVEQS